MKNRPHPLQAQHQQPHLPSHRDLLHIAGMGSALGVGFQPSPSGSAASEAEAGQKSTNLSGSDILDAKSHELRQMLWSIEGST
jgi:hypothetical protein